MTTIDGREPLDMPRDTAHFLDPYPWYSRMRTEAPVWRDPVTGEWIVFRYADVRRVLADPAAFSSAVPPAPGQELFLTSMNNTDDPRHRELRALVQKAFAPRRIAALAPRISAVTGALVDGLVEAGPGVEFVRAFSGALPAIVIAELLGVPAEDHDRFRGWADDVVLVGEPDRAEEAYAAMGAMAEYFTDLVALKRRSPGEDVMTTLAAAHDSGALTAPELVDFGLLLLTGGHETTTSWINNTLRSLHAHPAERARLRDDPALVPAMLEEVLRYRSPVHLLPRVTTAEVDLAGTTLPAGAVVLYCMGSANRDPAVFPDPDVFDIDRHPTEHIAFGHGLHGCLGNALARLEARTAVTALLDRLPGIDIDDDQPVVPVPTPQLHGVRRMAVRF